MGFKGLSDNDIYRVILDLQNRGEPFVLVTVTATEGPVPGKAGWKMVLSRDGLAAGSVGGGAVEKHLVDKAISLIEGGEGPAPFTERVNLKSQLGMCCGGVMEFFVEPHHPSPKLAIFGAGHIGRAVSTLGKMAGFQVIAIDERGEFAREENLPDADIILKERPEDLKGRLPWGRDLFIVIVTHEHHLDEESLRVCIGQEYRFLGMIGSRAKVGRIFAKLRNEGVPEELLSKVSAPVGIDIGARTAGEIAISIISEMVNLRRRGGEPIRFMKEIERG